MVGMRLSALRLPFSAGGESIFGGWWQAELGRIGVARTIFVVVIAGHKARSAVFASDDPAIHAGCRLAELRRIV